MSATGVMRTDPNWPSNTDIRPTFWIMDMSSVMMTFEKTQKMIYQNGFATNSVITSPTSYKIIWEMDLAINGPYVIEVEAFIDDSVAGKGHLWVVLVDEKGDETEAASSETHKGHGTVTAWYEEIYLFQTNKAG